jgi:glycosyltransferase involved in cell wall biosynthesis
LEGLVSRGGTGLENADPENVAALSVLHVAQPADGGVGAYVAAASADQAARGWDVAVACPDHGWLPRRLAAAGVRWLPWPAGRAPAPGSVAETLRLTRLIERAAPAVVHLHSSKAGLAGRLALRGRLPTLFQPHGWSWLAVQGAVAAASVRWERLAARWADVIVCVGVGEVNQGRANGVAGNYAMVRNGVDLDRFRLARNARAASRARLGIDPRARLAVCVGRVTRQKGQDLLLAAWPQITARRPDAQLCLVGDGELIPALWAQAPPGVRFCVAGDVLPWYAAADVVVLPSRWEGLSLALLEALASGRPVVATAIDGLAEAMPPNSGALVSPEDPSALAAEVGRRLDDPALVHAESQAAARHAEQFDIRRTFDLLAAVTQTAVAARGGAGALGRRRSPP